MVSALLDEPAPEGDPTDYIERHRKHLRAVSRELRKRQRRRTRETPKGQLPFKWEREAVPLRNREWSPSDDKGTHRSKDRPAVLDVQKRWRDVRRISRSLSQYRLCLDLGWQRAELDQELLVRVHLRQSMASRYDPTRGSVGKYLVIFCRGALLNLAKVRQRRAAHEQVGAIGKDGEVADAALIAREVWDG